MSLLRVESSAASLRRKRLAACGRIGSDHLKKHHRIAKAQGNQDICLISLKSGEKCRLVRFWMGRNRRLC